VKRLVAIEDLGNIEILFTDKTGTLTEGAITFERGSRLGRETRATAPLLLGLVCNESSMGERGRWAAIPSTRPSGRALADASGAETSSEAPPGSSAWRCCRSITNANWSRCS
jgi:Mg2+-importing ATPase